MAVEYSKLQEAGYKNISGLDSILLLLAIFACPVLLLALVAVIKASRRNTKCFCFYWPNRKFTHPLASFTLADQGTGQFQMPKVKVHGHETTTSELIELIVEFCIVVIPTAMIFSAPPTAVFGLPLIFAWVALLFAFLYAYTSAQKLNQARAKDNFVEEADEDNFEIFQLSRLPDSARISFVAYYRGTTTFIIATVILAVDFQCFPRAFAKTETYGMSLMDFGVGGVIFMSGLVSHTARMKFSNSCTSIEGVAKADLQRIAKDPTATEKKFMKDADSLQMFRDSNALRSVFGSNTIKLIILGLARLISVWGTSYHVPTGEYGVHWNFFFTIAIVSFVCSQLEPLLARVAQYKPIPTGWTISGVVFCIAAIIEYWHDSNLIPVTNLLPSSKSVLKESTKVKRVREWMFHGERMDAISANKEGIFSLPGYCCLRLLGTAVGCFTNHCAGATDNKGSPRLLLTVLVFLSAISLSVSTKSFGFEKLHGLFAHPSRRLCNFAYIMLTAGENIFCMATFLILDIVQRLLLSCTTRIADDTPTSLQMTGASKVIIAWQKSPLVLFLLANVQTGLVNLCPGLEPLRRPAWAGICVCCAHACVLSAVAVSIRKYRLY
jgi:phosphatidylinositol glycan class W